MKLFSPSSRALMRADIRVVNSRRLLLPGLLAALVLNLGVFAGGIWVGSGLEQPMPVAVLSDDTSAPEQHFTIDRVGILVGRLQALESDVLSLQKMLAEHGTLTRQVSALDPTLVPVLLPEKPIAAGDGQGGLLLPPRGCSGDEGDPLATPEEELRHGETVARCLRGTLDRLMEGVAQRNAGLMAIPSLRPVGDKARLGSTYGNRLDPFNRKLAFHSGVDFAIGTGANVYSAAGGKVRFVGRRGGYGKLVEIDHGNGLVTRYAHLSRYDVEEGQVVTPHQRIGAVGSTGRSTGPHLHFEVMHHGRFTDPQRFLALADMEREVDELVHD